MTRLPSGSITTTAFTNPGVPCVVPTGITSTFLLRTYEGRIPGESGFVFGHKRLTIGMSQANIKRYNRYLRNLIVAGRAVPGQIFSHEDAPRRLRQVRQMCG